MAQRNILAAQKERHKQLTWKANIKVSLWSPSPASTVLLVKVTRLDGISAIVIPCGPPVKSFKVLILSNQQWSGL